MLVPKAHRLAIYRYLFNGACRRRFRPAICCSVAPAARLREAVFSVVRDEGRRGAGCSRGDVAQRRRSTGGVDMRGWQAASGGFGVRGRGLQACLLRCCRHAALPAGCVACLSNCSSVSPLTLPRFPLSAEGVVVAKKDFRGRMHEDIKLEGATETLPNLQVAMLMKSMTSRGYTKESFSWQFYYWYLTNEGIEYLREYLHLPAEVMPNTLKKQAVRAPSRPSGDAYGDKKGGFGAPDGYRCVSSPISPCLSNPPACPCVSSRACVSCCGRLAVCALGCCVGGCCVWLLWGPPLSQQTRAMHRPRRRAGSVFMPRRAQTSEFSYPVVQAELRWREG